MADSKNPHAHKENNNAMLSFALEEK